MSVLRKFVLTLLFACGLFVATTALAAGASSAEGVMAAYKSAHAKANVGSLMALVGYQSSGSPLRQRWRDEFAREVTNRITSIKVVPFSTYASTPPGQLAKSLPPSIKPVGWLEIEFAAETSPGRSVQHSSVYLLAQENGSHFIVGP
jgi:hypothetical protein